MQLDCETTEWFPVTKTRQGAHSHLTFSVHVSKQKE